MRVERKDYSKRACCIILILIYSIIISGTATGSTLINSKEVEGVWLGEVTTEIVTFTGSENAKRDLLLGLQQEEARGRLEFSVNHSNQLQLISGAGSGFREVITLNPDGRVTGQHTKKITRSDSEFVAVHDISGQFHKKDNTLVLNMKITVMSNSKSSSGEDRRTFIYNYVMTKEGTSLPPKGEPKQGAFAELIRATDEIIKRSWEYIKELAAGDSFKVKFPTGACGVRG